MIYGFKGNKTTTAEEWLIDYSLKTSTAVNINPDLISMPIKFDDKEVDALILDVLDNRLVIQLVLPIATKFDDKSNRYETSYVRKLINSNKFLSRFNSEFVEHVQTTEVHTEDYVTNDKLWLLSHEEINQGSDWFALKPNHECHAFEMFKSADLKEHCRMLFKNDIDLYGLWLRSAYSSTSYDCNRGRYVSCVSDYGYISYDFAYIDYNLALACTIC